MKADEDMRAAVELRKRNAERDKRLYGSCLTDVTFLRSRGFGIHKEGRRYRVGNNLMTREGIASLARRERRLIRHAGGET